MRMAVRYGNLWNMVVPWTGFGVANNIILDNVVVLKRKYRIAQARACI